MWILPKQLHTLDSVQDTEALNLGLEESSQLCAQSLFVRSKPSPLRTWLQKWKRDSWTQHLYGRILNPSRGKAFEIEWTSSLEVTHANHSPQQESEQEKKTQDTCGLGLQTEFGFCDQECASLRTSKDTSRWDSPASSATWKSWVTRCRGEYSLRVKLAHPTSASGCLSWPTASVAGCVEGGVAANLGMNSKGFFAQRENGTRFGEKLRDVVLNWPSPVASEVRQGFQDRSKGMKGSQESLTTVVIKHGLPAPVNPSTNGNRQESWATPRSCSAMAATITPESANDPKRFPNLETQVGKQWATPQASDHIEGRRTDLDSNQKCLGRDMKQWATPQTRDAKGAEGRMIKEGNFSDLPSQIEVEDNGTWNRNNGKLNPRWVETLMGLPVGWVMPSCASPVTIELTNCDCLETESCQQLPSEHLELS